ncbi:2-hydroxy-3-keto-5-methylthiopentenyl-1-phosphate phosphatase [Ignavibacterium album JCM 16511]|uniref:2-hydroxy-3-keto-5-methylthiopentenyl-1-phosphate phosphatase n=1 Tax=Ignavibacterium album (strain DSM 19864 / JCM 16511 / NBRC 101810 / Mat9-16) TaxID=945713 RepID=I0AGF1_IGNAJ|nr:MtnX-like HAD-IB family phosphatase [Ignavibacterium album]AFH48058.1 2-hydroxy-3-keto-5-methylthiopentenyl-1-phosphate phosphatase [Ignavibacterium album JCM 16511]
MDGSKLKVFVDFDGTITTEDVGDSIFRKFGEPELVKTIIDDLHNNKISSRKCWDLLCASVNRIDENDLNKFIDEMKVNPTFKPFVNFCDENKVALFVLSDGFDFYIKRILSREGLSRLKFFANKLQVIGGKLVPEYPYFNPDYPSSANPKQNHIINNSSDDDYTIYIGDGNSDKEAAQYCDYIFAKNSLLKFCERERISYWPFKDFNDVTIRIKELLSKKRLKKRHQAQIKRKHAYEAE